MLTTLAVGFATAATLLAMIGLYGVLAFSAAIRTKEIGIRLALGATRWEAGGLIVREAVVLAAIGLAIALPAAWALGRLVESQLFGVQPLDGATIAGAISVLVLVCLVAGRLADQDRGRSSRRPARFQRLAQVRDVRLQRADGPRWRLGIPQVLDETIHRDHLAAADQQQRKNGALSRSAEVRDDLAAVAVDGRLQGSEHSDAHHDGAQRNRRRPAVSSPSWRSTSTGASRPQVGR